MVSNMSKTYAREQIDCSKGGRTRQCFKDECDVNRIMKKWTKDGLLSHVAAHQGDYGDFTGVQDYHTSHNQMIAAEEAFMSLPSQIRKKFANDPASFLNFVSKEENFDEMVEMGLANPRPPTKIPDDQPPPKEDDISPS